LWIAKAGNMFRGWFPIHHEVAYGLADQHHLAEGGAPVVAGAGAGITAVAADKGGPGTRISE